MTPRSLVPFILLVGVLAGCGGSEGPQASSDDQSESTPPKLVEVRHADAMEVVKGNGAQVTVVNFWATWCVPCVEEFPSFVKLEENLSRKGVDVMFISTDFPTEKKNVRSFLTEHGVHGTSYLKTGNSTTFVNNFSTDWSGAVPATFVYDAEGRLLSFWEGKVSYEDLKKRVTRHLKDA